MFIPFLILLVLTVLNIMATITLLFYSRNIRNKLEKQKKEIYNAIYQSYETLKRDIDNLDEAN